MAEVYIHMRDADVDRTTCLNAVANADYDANGGLVGIEVLGAIRVDVDGVQVTPQASSAERSEELVCRCAPTPSAAPVQISEPVFLGVVRASGDWENWDGNQIAAAVDRARRVLRSEGIEVVS